MTPRGLDTGVLSEIESIVAVDDHAHPLPLGLEPEPDFDRPIYPYDHPYPVRQRQTNPEYIDAWHALWGYEHQDFDGDHLRELILAKQQIKAKHGDDYNAWVLDQISVETTIAIAYDRVDSLPEPRFRWCSFADWLLWPVLAEGSREPQLVTNYVREMAAACSRAGLDSVPETVEEYLETILEPELRRRRDAGAVALKFQTAYYRPIDFSDVTLNEAARLYERGVRDGSLPTTDHRALQDYLFDRLARVAGELELPLQIHTGLGAKPHFDTLGSNPLLLERVVSSAPETKFLLLHAGWPFDREAVSALAHENVYMDFSCATIHLYPRALAEIIRNALEWFPEKVMYGTDAYSDRSLGMLSGVEVRPNFLSGWEEKAWLMDRTSRHGLALALTGMREDGIITNTQVRELADRVMSVNAKTLYRLDASNRTPRPVPSDQDPAT